MDKRQADLLRRLGPVDEWLLPASEIEDALMTATCRHGQRSVYQCKECSTSVLLRRQVTFMSKRRGLSPEDAQRVSDTLCDQFLEEKRR